MAAPTPVTRLTPAGIKLPDGFRSLIAFERDPDLSIWEMGGKIPGIDGGEAIEQTTMHNVAYRTFAARQLVTLTKNSIKFAYDPACYTQILALVNRNGAITQTFGDNSSLTYYGYCQKVDFDDLEEGKLATGTMEIVPTNYDPTNKVEAGPVLTSVSGT